MKPIISKTISAFDANIGATIPFSWSGNKSYKNVLYFYDDTNTLVFTSENTTFRLENTFDGNNNLENGKMYYIQIKVIDGDDIESELSDSVLIYCFTTPHYNLNSLIDGMTVKQSFIQSGIFYAQAEGEELDSFQFYIYGFDNQLLYTSDVLYSLNDYIKVSLDNGEYKIKSIGTTVNGMSLDTGLISFRVEYEIDDSEYLFATENRHKEGRIRLYTNISTFDYNTNNIIINDGSVDVRDGYLEYYDGLSVDQVFVLKFTVSNLNECTEILNLSKEDFNIKISYMTFGRREKGEDVMAYLLAEIGNKDVKSILTTNTFEPVPSEEDVIIYLKNINGLYTLKAMIGGELY